MFLRYHETKWMNEYSLSKSKFYLKHIDDILAADILTLNLREKNRNSKKNGMIFSNQLHFFKNVCVKPIKYSAGFF